MAFEQRATRYEQGWLGRLHHQIAGQTAALAVTVSAAPRRVLDIGCGPGYLLRLLARQYPRAGELIGGRRGKARTPARASQLLGAAGFTSIAWHDLYPLIKAVTATPRRHP